MFEIKTRQIVQEKYIELVGQIIDELRNIAIHSLPDSGNIPFETVWDAFVAHFQHSDELPTYNIYSDIIVDICQEMVETLTLTELKLLWLVSEGCLEWDESEDFPDVERMLEDVAEELISWIEQEAEEPELEPEELITEENRRH